MVYFLYYISVISNLDIRSYLACDALVLPIILSSSHYRALSNSHGAQFDKEHGRQFQSVIS